MQENTVATQNVTIPASIIFDASQKMFQLFNFLWKRNGNLDLCCTPAGRDLAYGLMSWLRLGPKCHLFRQNSHRLQRGVLPE